VSLAPIVRNSVREDSTVPVESGCRDSSTDRRITLETVLGVLVPEREG